MPRLVITVRDPEEGGIHSYDPEEKLEFLRNAVNMGFLVDVESRFAEEKHFDCSNQIVSRHYLQFDPSYEEVSGFVEKYSDESRITKIALRAGQDSRKILVRLLGKYKNIAVMETDGEGSSRILYSILGSRLLYCHAGEKTSPGQIGCEEAEGIFSLIRKMD